MEDRGGRAGPFGEILPAACSDKEGVAFSVREFEHGDRVELEKFYEEFEPKRRAQGLPPLGTERIQRWLDSILSEGAHLLVESENQLVGHALLVPTGREGVWEYAIFLRQDYRGRGLGTAVNRLTAEVGRALGLRKIWLSVEPHNRAAVRSYEKVGFRFLSSTIFATEVEMELDL